MTIKIRCACGNVLCAPEERIGDTGRCPNCNRQIKVEKPAEENIPTPRPDSNKQLPSESKSVKYEPAYLAPPLTAVPVPSKTPPKKQGLLLRFFSFLVYLMFISLLISTILIHTFSKEQLSEFHWWNIDFLQTTWKNYEPDILLIKEIQANWFLSLFEPSPAGKKEQINQEKTKDSEMPKIPNGQDNIPKLPNQPAKSKLDKPI